MTKLDSICEIIAALEFPEDDAEKLLAAIAEYRATRGSSYKRLMRISGFAKLWDAIEESRESLCPDAAALTRPLAPLEAAAGLRIGGRCHLSGSSTAKSKGRIS